MKKKSKLWLKIFLGSFLIILLFIIWWRANHKKKVIFVSEPVAIVSAGPKVSANIVRVVDGDTVQVNVEGKTETVRLIGMNAPESVDPRKPVQCFGMEASNKAKEVLADKKVFLETDPVEGDKDIYGRFLRYIFLEDGTNFSKLMINEGYAREYTYYGKQYKYRDEFKNSQQEAKAEKMGLWGVCK